MSKYIIEIDDDLSFDVQFLQAIGAESNGVVRILHIEFEGLEELNSDYINEHFGDLQDMAYQRGLDDAWEAARKIVCDDELDWNTLLHLFNRSNFEGIFGDFSPSETIAKLKAYEEKQKADDKIEVGDEVNWLGDCFIVTRIFQPRNMKEQCDGIDDDGCVYHDVLIKDLEKTGRHFDIQSILEEMRT